MTPARPPRPTLRPLFVKFGLVTAVAVAGVVASAQPPAARSADATLALRVRQALDDHPALRPYQLNLLVNVVDGVVVVGGPVPDAKLAEAVEGAVKAVEGVARVKVSVWQLAAPRSDPLAMKFDEKLNPKPTPPTTPAVTLSVPTDPRPTAGVTGRKPDLPDPSSNILQPPVPSAERTSRAPHSRPPGAEPPEYTPIPATNLPTEPIAEPPSNATPVRAAPPRDAERESDAWKRDPRFAGLTVEVRNATAVIGGRAKSKAVAWELAEQVRNWPAVERVAVGRVEVVR